MREILGNWRKLIDIAMWWTNSSFNRNEGVYYAQQACCARSEPSDRASPEMRSKPLNTRSESSDAQSNGSKRT